jgi:hypothetical protein
MEAVRVFELAVAQILQYSLHGSGGLMPYLCSCCIMEHHRQPTDERVFVLSPKTPAGPGPPLTQLVAILESLRNRPAYTIDQAFDYET